MTLSGALRFGRYALAPNRLGYCGPPGHKALLEYVASGEADGGLLDLACHFDGAYPYLKLIAHENGTDDAFDDRVVEAYWLGNGLLRSIPPLRLHQHLEGRFAAQVSRRDFEWLATKVGLAHPHHNFHVFEIYKRAGVHGDPGGTVALSAMDSCRVSWGIVKSVGGAQLLVEWRPLTFVAGQLTLGEPTLRSVERQVDGLGFVDQARAGDAVSVHWDWACEILTPAALSNLQAVTRYYLDLANTTM
jgi:hypothetical protein